MRPRNSPDVGSRRDALRACSLAMLLLPATLLLISPNAAHGKANDFVVTYFAERSTGGERTGQEWRIFDPVRRTDEVFQTTLYGASAIYWDTSETYAEYAASGSIKRVAWEMGAQPWPVLRLPHLNEAFFDWWFNPDSLCWQVASGGGVARNNSRGGQPFAQCHYALWQSSRDGNSWHVIQTDTTECRDYFCAQWTMADMRPIHRVPMIGLKKLQDEMSIDGWGGTPQIIPPPAGESPSKYEWYFIPLRSSPERGVAFRIGHRTPSLKVFMTPLFLLDRKRGTQVMLETPTLRRDQDTWHIGMAERDGFLLVSGSAVYVFDLSTGAQVFKPPAYSRGSAVWVKRPRAPHIDEAGLRRLRARFR